MQKNRFVALAIASALFTPVFVQAQFATGVQSYNPGSDVTPGYTYSSVALGAPSTFMGYQDADPFNPPYMTNHIVGVGAGGSLTLRFDTSIQNNPANPYGLDFIIFGHAGFNENFTDFTATDGSFFTGGTANVRVSVSMDGSTFYRLNPAFAPMVDGLFPTDANGNPFQPVNPSLTAGAFAGQNLNGIRALYNGSAGGAGFDLSWALDGNDQSVFLSSIGYVRLETLNGTAY